MADYRKKYAEAYGITWDRNKYEIHHIDLNHDNNDLDNLVLLPGGLHRELHAAISGYRLFGSGKSLDDAVRDYMGAEMNGCNDWLIGVALLKVMEVVRKCRRYGFMKEVGYPKSFKR
jgi:hypothetical protein